MRGFHLNPHGASVDQHCLEQWHEIAVSSSLDSGPLETALMSFNAVVVLQAIARILVGTTMSREMVWKLCTSTMVTMVYRLRRATST